MKIRITSYYLARSIFNIINPLWWGVLRRGIHFNKTVGRDYKSRKIDEYYLLEFK